MVTVGPERTARQTALHLYEYTFLRRYALYTPCHRIWSELTIESSCTFGKNYEGYYVILLTLESK